MENESDRLRRERNEAIDLCWHIYWLLEERMYNRGYSKSEQIEEFGDLEARIRAITTEVTE
jgi:hypothetical protein